MTVPTQREYASRPSNTSRRKRRAAAFAFLTVTGAMSITLATEGSSDASTITARPPESTWTTTDGYRQAGAAGGLIGSVGACVSSAGWACAAVGPAAANFEVVQQTTPQVPALGGDAGVDGGYVPLGPGSI